MKVYFIIITNNNNMLLQVAALYLYAARIPEFRGELARLSRACIAACAFGRQTRANSFDGGYGVGGTRVATRDGERDRDRDRAHSPTSNGTSGTGGGGVGSGRSHYTRNSNGAPSVTVLLPASSSSAAYANNSRVFARASHNITVRTFINAGYPFSNVRNKLTWYTSTFCTVLYNTVHTGS